MIITSTKKKKPNKLENIQKVIDSAGETQFKNIYKNLQTEIKDKIITNLLSKLDKQNKQIEEYKKEIMALKNDLVYLLKRIIILKNEERTNGNAKVKNNKLKKNTTKTNNMHNSPTFSILNNTSSQNLYNQTENNIININKLSSFNNLNSCPINNMQNELDTKINNYINSIYKHNFLKNETNINDYYSLNKTDNLFEEIFQKKNTGINNELFIGNEPNMNKKKNLHSNNSKRNISSPLTKRQIESIDDRKKNKHFSSSMVNIKNRNNYINDYKTYDEFEENINNSDNACENDNSYKKGGKMNITINDNNFGNKYLKVKKKSADFNTHYNQMNNYKTSKHNGFYSVTIGNKVNYNNDLKKKIKRNNHYIPLNRSPFLVNKF